LKTGLDKISWIVLAFEVGMTATSASEIFIVFRNWVGGSTIGIPSQLRKECNAECLLVRIVGQFAPA
jgi:hypothetical protein